MRELSSAKVESSYSVLWAHGDNVLTSTQTLEVPCTSRDLKLLLNLYGLFAEHLLVPDLPLLNNRTLRQLIENGYDRFLTEGVLVPVLRDWASSFLDLIEYEGGRSDGYGLPGPHIAKAYAEKLDAMSSVLRVPGQDIRERLDAAYSDTLLNEHFLQASGLTPYYEAIVDFVKKQRKVGSDRFIRRSDFFFLADALERPRDRSAARKIREAATIVYMNGFQKITGTRPGIPEEYARAQYALVAPPDSFTLATDELVTDETWDIDIERLGPEAVVELRRSQVGKEFFKQARSAKAAHTPYKALELHAEALTLYLAKIREVASLVGMGKRAESRRLDKRLRMIRWRRRGISAGLAVVGVGATLTGVGAIPVALGLGSGSFGFLWSFIKEPTLEKDIAQGKVLTLAEWDRIKSEGLEDRSLTHVPIAKNGRRPPIF